MLTGMPGFGGAPFGGPPGGFGGPPGGFGGPPFGAPYGAPYGGGFPPYGGGFPAPYGGAGQCAVPGAYELIGRCMSLCPLC